MLADLRFEDDIDGHQHADDDKKVNERKHWHVHENLQKEKDWGRCSSGVSFLEQLEPPNGVGLPEEAKTGEGIPRSNLTEEHVQEVKKGLPLKGDKCSYKLYTVVHIASNTS